MRGAPKGPTRGFMGAKGRGTKPAERTGRQRGGSDEDDHTPPSRGGRGRGMGGSRRPTLVHLGTQDTMDEDDRSASLTAIQEAHSIMLMQHCLQSWEDSERVIGFGHPLQVATESPPLETELSKKAVMCLGTTPQASTIARRVDLESLDHKLLTAEAKIPKPPSQDSKNQTPGRDGITGVAKGKQNTRTLVSDTRPGPTRQIGNGRGKPRQVTYSLTTNPSLDTVANKDAFPPTQQQTQFQSSDSPPQIAEDTFLGSTQGETEKPKSPLSSLDPQTGAGLHREQMVTSVNEKDLELRTGPTPQGQSDSEQGPQSEATARGGLIPTEPSRKARKGKTLPITKDQDRQDLLLTGPTPPTPADSDQGSQTGTTIHEGLISSIPSRTASNEKAPPTIKEDDRHAPSPPAVTTGKAPPDPQTNMPWQIRRRDQPQSSRQSNCNPERNAYGNN